MKIQNQNTCVTLSDENGSILSYLIDGVEFMATNSKSRPLFILKLLKDDGSPVYLKAFDAETMTVKCVNGGYDLLYSSLCGMDVNATVTVRIRENGAIGWGISIVNNSGFILESSELPCITVPDKLKAAGGDYKLFWPGLEGFIIEDAGLRDKTWIEYYELGEQSRSFSGFYPGSCPMQFMAYYNNTCGLYFASHDAKHQPKAIEYHLERDGIKLEQRLFCGGAEGEFTMEYETITAPLSGDWHDAAEIYRSWMEDNTNLPKKLYENKDIPDWVEKSPIVTIYPIRGTSDNGDMTPNMYYPYKNALPYIEEISEKTDSTIMTLLMHWEGTAPWATPYVWPPFGGVEKFTDFVSALHEKGHLAGVYCSGIGWTTYSFNNPELDFSDKYDDMLICCTPHGTHVQSKVIAAPIRLGYDMCPHSHKVSDIVSQEVASIAKAGCDYIQYFDQNLGGASSLCYARHHGHPPAPGKWQNEDMINIFKRVIKDLKDMGLKTILGCECAAGEPFIGYLPFNDLRFPIGFMVGNAVPAYSYLFHEYLNNFMGNQCACDHSIDCEKTPYSLLYRTAYSFMAGDMLTIVIRENGLISWAWGSSYDNTPPEQKPVFDLMKELNRHRRDFKEFIHYGKMVKPLPISSFEDISLHRVSGDDIIVPSLLTSRWKSRDGKEMQVIVNWREYKQTFGIDCKNVYSSMESFETYNGSITLPPLSAIWVE